ncbi:hypothetical protein AKO1_005000 [Acrasis kona]|uniref:Uncharacterized protein n=1 Tax=Acrasis kona TaxID=1008807 RepID=A0AAW2Z4Q1_9EUKA
MANHQTQWKQPDFKVPLPKLTFVLHLECDLEPVKEVGTGPYGKRLFAGFLGGRFEGPKLRGEILPHGGDWLLVNNETSVAHLDTRYNLRTHDGALIYIQTRGTRTGPKETLDELYNNPNIDPNQYCMRLNCFLETGDERYKWVNNHVFVATCARRADMVIYDMFCLE